MKYSVPLLLSAAFAAAAPSIEGSAVLEKRQRATELSSGSCKDVTFIWVRGTTEAANLGQIIGGKLVPQLRKVFPSLAVEGVEYGAGVAGNLTPGGGDPAGIKEATKDYNLAASKCPKTVLIGGGYSQGAAITHRTVEALPEKVKILIAGIVLFGDTKFKQDGGVIKNFPPAKVKVFCNGYGELKGKSADGVCNGALNVNAGHMSYGDSFKPAAQFLKGKVDAFKSSKGSAPAAPATPEAEPAAEAAPATEAAPAASDHDTAEAAPAAASPAKPKPKAAKDKGGWVVESTAPPVEKL
ncbi:hypothetical protein E2P81_ATG00962 [Venturia nashicola]|nr:hypothetical protein E2P81_ATG00962 [Venturia nashicola]